MIMIDVLSDILETAQLESAVQYRAEFTEPWGFEVPNRRHHASFYLILSGTCWLEFVADEANEQYGSEERLQLREGDLVMLTHGSGHRLRDAAMSPAINTELLDKPDDQKNGCQLLAFGGPGVATQLILGCFQFNTMYTDLLRESLPSLLHVSAPNGRADERLTSTLHLLELEVDEARLGSRVIIRQLANTLFIQIVRFYVDRLIEACGAANVSNESVVRGWLRGLANDHIGYALTLIHERPERPWTVATLAQAVGLSRTAFATLFNDLVGLPPLKYLRRWRMCKASQLLQTEQASVSAIAYQFGYESESAFNRAFKREFGKTPGRFRRGYE